jgi:hypothetical protein
VYVIESTYGQSQQNNEKYDLADGSPPWGHASALEYGRQYFGRYFRRVFDIASTIFTSRGISGDRLTTERAVARAFVVQIQATVDL